MKLASLKSGRDGALHVVKNDLSAMADAQDIAPTLQAALDDWSNIRPRLQDRYEALEAGLLTSQPFDQTQAASPLPRAYQWADGSAYVNHVELVRKARNAEMPASFWTTPLMYQGGSDSFLAPFDPIKMVQSEGFGIDFEAEIAVITGDVPMGVKADEAAELYTADHAGE